MAFDHSRSLLSLRPVEGRRHVAADPDGAKVNAILNACINAEQVHVFRCLLWRRFAIATIVAWALEAFTPLLPGIGLAVVVLLLGTGAVGALVWERRTQHILQTLLDAK